MLPEVLNLWQQTPLRSIRLINAYGPTEATITATAFETFAMAARVFIEFLSVVR